MEAEGTHYSSSSFFPECLLSAGPFLPYRPNTQWRKQCCAHLCIQGKAFPFLSAPLEGAHVINPPPSAV